ncbi:MAG: 16S rRNA (guanine(527)-N(7))-methyltransferase RsmG [Candidatus Eremiobacteraeota bacterium]|nr:16S rRNA (guanine(527)-N(7))-methyltransferase RsmG [Candidatus Eremiobacteraeota bacterium]
MASSFDGDPVRFLREGARGLDLELSRGEADVLLRFCDEVMFWNRIINITSFRSLHDILVHMFLDSLASAPLLATLPCHEGADLGTGGGFPGIPLAVVRRDMRITLIESSNKKADFLVKLTRLLSLDHVRVVEERAGSLHASTAEDLYEVVFSRACAPLSLLISLAFPLLREGGRLLAWKGPALSRELRDAGETLLIYRGEVEKLHSYSLPGTGARSILVVKKCGSPPGRVPGKPSKKRNSPHHV